MTRYSLYFGGKLIIGDPILFENFDRFNNIIIHSRCEGTSEKEIKLNQLIN